MRATTTQTTDRFEEIDDRDVETLIRGGIPENTHLMPLRGIVAELRSLAHWTISESFVEFHAAEAAELCAARNPSTSYTPGPGRRMADSVRRRTATAAATLAMFASATGVAVASDGAVPGDWNYGIDRALEYVGIGAGGENERLQELQVLEGPELPTAASSEQSAWVAKLIEYFSSVDTVDGASVSEIASEGAKPEDPGAAGRANQPEDPGAAGRANQPEDPGAAGRANQPEDPGAAGRANQPDVPGTSGSANQPEDPGDAETSDQTEDPDGAGKSNKPEDPGAAAGSGQADDLEGADSLDKAGAADRSERASKANSKP